jgi:hypothetical protein
MREKVDLLICDAQGLLRHARKTGEVNLRPISETGFAEVIRDLDYLKASESEARFIDAPIGRAALVVTAGQGGSRLVLGDRSTLVPTIPVKEVDATGAGDSFVAGFSLEYGSVTVMAPFAHRRSVCLTIRDFRTSDLPTHERRSPGEARTKGC